MKKLCLFILSVLIIFASGCNKADIGKNDANNNSEQNTISGAAEQNKENIGSKFMGVWYYTNYSSPDYADDFEKIEIVPCGEDKAKVLWADGTEDIFEIISENEGIGTYGEIEKARYCIDNEDGAEHFNVTEAETGPIFQPGVGGYRTLPSGYKTRAEAKKRTIEKLKSTKKVWQHYSGDAHVPENEIIINDVTENSVTFSFLAYRLDDFINKTGTIGDDGTICFENISGDVDGGTISGNISVYDKYIHLYLTKSTHPYFKNGEWIDFDRVSDESVLY